MLFFFQINNQGFMRNRLTVNQDKIPVFTVVSKHIMDTALPFCGILFNFNSFLMWYIQRNAESVH